MIILALYTSSDYNLSMCRVLFPSILSEICSGQTEYCKRRKGSHSVNTGDMVIVLAFCHFPHGPLVVNQVSFHSLVYFQTYSPDKLFIAKIKKGSKSVNTVDRVMHLSSCTFFDNPLSMYQVSINSHENFERCAADKLFMAKLKREVTP